MNISKYKIVGQGILLVFVAILPILFLSLSSFSLEPFKTFITLFVGTVLMLGIIIHKIKKDSFSITKNMFFMSIVLVLFSSVLSTFFSNNFAVSLFGRQISALSLSGIIALFALAYAVSILFDDTKQKIKLFFTIYISGLILVLLHLLSILVPFFPTFGFFVNNSINTLGQWYDLGLYGLFFTLSSAIILQFFKNIKFYKILGWIGLIAGLVLIILINSKLIFVMAILFTLFNIVFNAITQNDFEIKNKISYEVLSILIISVVFLLIGSKSGLLVERFLNLQSAEIKPSISSTLEITKHVLTPNDMIRPFFGVGLDRFDTAWLAYRPTNTNLTKYWDVDFRYGYSTILSFAVTQGILGILAWLLFIVVSVYYAIKLLFISNGQKNDLFIYSYSVLGYMFFLISMIVYTPSISITALMFVFLGFFISNLKQAELISFREIFINRNPRISFFYILILVLFLIGFIYLGYIHLSQYASRVVFESANKEFSTTGDLQKLESKIQTSQFLYYSDVYERILAEIGILRLNQIVQDKTLTEEQAVSQFQSTLKYTVDHSSAAIIYDNQSYVNRISLISIYKNLLSFGVKDAKDEVIKLIEATEQLTPNNPTLSLEKARIFALAKEYDMAIENIKKSIELKPNYIDAAFLLSQIQVEKGEIDQAIKSIQSAIQVDGSNLNLKFQLGLLYYNQGQYNNAVGVFQDLANISPNFANAQYFLGLSYYKNNRTSDAIVVFEKLQKQVPDNQEVQLILNNLKSGQDPFYGAKAPIDNQPENREELPLEDKNVEVEGEQAPVDTTKDTETE